MIERAELSGISHSIAETREGAAVRVGEAGQRAFSWELGLEAGSLRCSVCRAAEQNISGCSAHAIACKPSIRLLAGVFSSSSLMQNTRRSRTAGRFAHPRCSTIFLQGDAISGATPGGDDDVGLRIRYVFGGGSLAGLAEESAAGRFDQFSYPGLRRDERLAPLFAEDERTAGRL